MLFSHDVWKILVQARGNLTNREAENPFLEIDILAFGGCQTPDSKSGIYLYGVDIDLRFVKGKLICIPFLRTGQGFLLCDEISDSEQQIRGLFYEIKDMFILDYSKYC